MLRQDCNAMSIASLAPSFDMSAFDNDLAPPLTRHAHGLELPEQMPLFNAGNYCTTSFGEYGQFHDVSSVLPNKTCPMLNTSLAVYSENRNPEKPFDPWFDDLHQVFQFSEEGHTNSAYTNFRFVETDQRCLSFQSTGSQGTSYESRMDFLDDMCLASEIPNVDSSIDLQREDESYRHHDQMMMSQAPLAHTLSTSSSEADDTYNDSWIPEDLHEIGFRDVSGNWRCKHPVCASGKTFLRACDLRKHYRNHVKSFFCEEKDCVWAAIGFSNTKDWRRHMQSHDPQIVCPYPGCERRFGRVDNMKAHYSRIHCSARNNLFPRGCRKSSQRREVE